MKTMTKITNRGLGSAALALILMTAACDDAVTGPELGSTEPVAFNQPASAMTTSTGEDVLTWSTAMVETTTVTQTVGKWGGMLSIDGLITLTVPPEALEERTELSMTAFAGEDIAFEFGPHGTQFNEPVSIWLDLCAVAGFDTSTSETSSEKKGGGKKGGKHAETTETDTCSGSWWENYSWDSQTAPTLDIDGLVAVYFTEAGPEVETLDIIEVELLLNRYLRFKTDHFSGYALAW